MVRLFFVIITALFFNSCFYSRTEFGNIRFKSSRFTIKPNSNDKVYKIIDTTKLYERVAIVDTVYNEMPTTMRKQYLKFYSNGRVGEFDFYDSNNLFSLNSKKAKMAYYNYNDKDLVIQFYFEHPQGGGLLKYKLFKIDNNKLELTGYNNIVTYKIIDLPKEFLIYKPDW